MTIETIISDWWWVGALVVVLIILILIMRNLGKKNSSGKVCKHNFIYGGSLVLTKDGIEHPRQIQYCNKCGEAYHLPIRTLKRN